MRGLRDFLAYWWPLWAGAAVASFGGTLVSGEISIGVICGVVVGAAVLRIVQHTPK